MEMGGTDLHKLVNVGCEVQKGKKGTKVDGDHSSKMVMAFIERILQEEYTIYACSRMTRRHHGGKGAWQIYC